MRTIWIPVVVAGAIVTTVALFLLRGEDGPAPFDGGARGGSESSTDDRTRSDAAASFDDWDPSREPPPPNELLEPPPEVEAPSADDAEVVLTALPGASWDQIVPWFRTTADLDARLTACEEILTALPRERALDRLLLLAASLTPEEGAVSFGLALGERLAPTARDSASELERFRRVLTRGATVGERSVALPPVIVGARYAGLSLGVIEAFELAFYKVPDPRFAATLLDALDAIEVPSRAARLVRAEFDRAAGEPGSGHFEAALVGVARTFRVLERAERDLAAGAVPVGSPLRTEVRLAHETGLRQTLVERVFTLGSDGRRTESEVEAAIAFLEEHARGRLSRFRSALEENRALEESREAEAAGGDPSSL